MMKTPSAILLLVALLGSYEALPVEGEHHPQGEPHPGTCPHISVYCKQPQPPPQCQSDSGCLKTQKCCNVCGNKCLTAVRVHAGSCPPPPPGPFRECPLIRNICKDDSGCAEDEKCCKIRCSDHTHCVKLT